MSREEIIRVCVSKQNIETLLMSLPSYARAMATPHELLRLIKIEMNSALAQAMKQLDHVGRDQARQFVIAIDRKVHAEVSKAISSMCITRIDDLPLIPGLEFSSHDREPETFGESSPLDTTEFQTQQTKQTKINHDQLPSSETTEISQYEHLPVSSEMDESGETWEFTGFSSSYEIKMPEEWAAGSLIEIVRVSFANETGPLVTSRNNCFYFSEDDHPMHTIKIPVKRWPSLQQLITWIQAEMNRLSSRQYTVSLTPDKRILIIGKASGKQTFNLLFEQTPNGIHRVLGFTRRNHKGKTAYRSEPLNERSSPSTSAVVKVADISWKIGDHAKQFSCPSSGLLPVKTMDEFGLLYDFGQHTLRFRACLREPILTSLFPSL